MPNASADLSQYTTTLAHHAADPFWLLVESVRDYALYLLDAKGKVYSWNTGAERLFGYTADEIIGRPLSCLYPPDEIACDEPEQELVTARTVGRHEAEGFRLRKDGSRFWAFSTTTVISDAADHHIGYARVVRDVSAEHTGLALLRRQAQSLDQSFDPILTWEIDGGIIYWNRSAERLYGFTADVAVGRVSSELLMTVFPAGRDEFLASLREHGFWRGVLEQTAEDGRRITVDSVFTTITQPGDGVLVLEENRDITEQRKIEAELRRNEWHLRTILDTEPECVKLLDADGLVLEMNPAGLKIVEADSFEEVRNRHLLSLVDEGYRDAFRDLNARVFRGETGSLIFQVTGLKGRRRWLETHATPLRDEDGVIRALLGVTRDISEQKAAEERLRQSETDARAQFAELEQLYQTAPVGLALVDRDLRFVRINERLAEINGCSVADHLGKMVREVVPDLAPVLDPLYAGVFATGEPCLDIEVCGTTPSQPGVVRDWLASYYPLADDHGAVTAVSVVVKEITARKQAELQHRQHQQRLASIINTVEGIVWEADLETLRFSFVSPWAEKLLGYPCARWIEEETFWADHIHPDDRRTTVESCSEACRRGHDHELVYRMVAADGRTVWLRDIVTVVADPGTRPMLRGIMVDITAQRQLELQLQQAQKMEAVGQLAGGVAHDFNNLLTVISGYSEILLSSMAPDDPMRDALTAIHDAGDRAGSLTRQLLAFSRQSVLEPKTLFLNDEVRVTEKMLRRLIGEDVLLATRLDPTISPVKVDPGQLGQVLMNLAVNARDAMPRGGKLTLETRNTEFDEVYCQLHPGSRPGRYVQLAVTDTGSGMPPEIQSRIFDPFFTTKGVGRGTGLGLAVVYGIIKQSDGAIEVESEPDRGTTFRCYFPAVTVATAAAVESLVPQITRGTETVLIVEDEDGVREFATLALQMYGYTVLSATDGNEALTVAEQFPGRIDLLVTDLVMPGMSGRDLADRMKSSRPVMATLFVSGYTDDTVIRTGLIQETIAFLQKPFSLLALAQKVRTVLDGTDTSI